MKKRRQHHGLRLTHSSFTTLLCALTLFSACRGTGDASQASSQPKSAETTVRAGNVELTVRSARDRVAVAERFNLSLVVTTPRAIDVSLPRAAETLGDFTVVSTNDLPPVPEKDRNRVERQYVLENDLSGQKTIPAITIKFTAARPSASQQTAGQTQAPANGEELSSEPLEIEVTSELADNADLSKFRDIKGPLAIPQPFKWLWWAVGASAILFTALAIWLWRRRRAAILTIARRIIPHEWAAAEFNRLAAEKFAERGEFHEFYFRLSSIVRRYIELRFRLMAPERTTEEFLVEARRSHHLSESQKQTLGAFLQACDEVKFALYQPSLPESERALATARDFVHQTTPIQTPPLQTPTPPQEVAA